MLKNTVAMAATIILLNLVVLTSASYGQEEFKLFLNDHEIEFENQQAFVDQNENVLVPVRYISNGLDLEVEWSKEKTNNGWIEITRKLSESDDNASYSKVENNENDENEQEKINLSFEIGEPYFFKNGEVNELEAKPQLTHNNRTLVPLEALAESFGFEVEKTEENEIHIFHDEIEDVEKVVEKLESIAEEEKERVEESKTEEDLELEVDDEKENEDGDEEVKKDHTDKKIDATAEILADYGTLNRDTIEKLVYRTEELDLDLDLVLGLIRVESNFDPGNVSWAGAVGLFQVMPGTAQRLADARGYEYSRELLYDPKYSIKVGTAYLNRHDKNYGGDRHKILTAYNKGSQGLDQHINATGSAVSSFSNLVLEKANHYQNRLNNKLD